MFTPILVGLAVIIFVFLVIVAMQPPSFNIVRSAGIAASPNTVFGHINDFHKWDAWSPWAKLDPEMKQTFEGPSEGAGSVYSWVGNKKVGEGRMTLLESRPGEVVRIKLEFIKPFASVADTEFTLKPEGNQTAVTWDMKGQKNFMSKAFCMFVSMDKMVGKDFERGLASLKSVAEGSAKQ